MLGTELLRGELVHLTAFTKADASTMARWYENAEFMRLWDSELAFPRTEEELAEMMTEERKSKRTLPFAVRRISDDALVGVCALDGIEWNNRVAGLAIGLGPEYWDQGYGTEAMRLVLRYAFTEANLHRVQLTVFDYNARALALYRKLGFQHEGTFREFVCRDGRRYDMLLMGILEREWRAHSGEGQV